MSEPGVSAGGVLRFGMLGAAPVSGGVLFAPLRKRLLQNVAAVTAVASRDPSRAHTLLRRQRSPSTRVVSNYSLLLADANVECVYIPLVNGLHFEWTMKALEAGKHVLVEKPMALNAGEARLMTRLALARNLVLMEGMHWWYHPFRQRMQEVLSGGVGIVRNVSVTFESTRSVLSTGMPQANSVARGGGGSSLDIGGYTLSCLAALASRGLSSGPIKVLRAQAERASQQPSVDEGMVGEVRFGSGDGPRAFFRWTYRGQRTGTTVVAHGSEGIMRANNFLIPHSGGKHGRNSITVSALDGHVKSTEHVKERRGLTTYDLQLLAFSDAVRAVGAGTSSSSEAFENTGDKVVALAATIDAVYAQAGMTPRVGPAQISV